ncbi:retrovirus-related pol polyprotein from transposon TNT 1-94 [Tanacetum coccineum]
MSFFKASNGRSGSGVDPGVEALKAEIEKLQKGRDREVKIQAWENPEKRKAELEMKRNYEDGAFCEAENKTMKRILLPVLNSAIQSLLMGNSDLIGGDGWTSALTDVPIIMGNNGNNGSAPEPVQNVDQAPKSFFDFCKDHEILNQYTLPGTPQQNGVAETRNRTIMDMVRNDILLASNNIDLLHKLKCLLSRNFDMKDLGEASMLDSFQSNPGLLNWKAAKKVLRYLQGTKEYKLTYMRSTTLKLLDTRIQTLRNAKTLVGQLCYIGDYPEDDVTPVGLRSIIVRIKRPLSAVEVTATGYGFYCL